MWIPGAADEALALPLTERGPALVGLSEGQWFERKSARISARDLADTMVSLANAEGGTIVLGIWNGRIEGVDAVAGDRVPEWQQAAADFTVPPVPCVVRLVGCVDGQGTPNRLVVVHVEASEQVHANRKDEVFLRIGDESRRLTFGQRQELHYDKGQSTYESTLVADASLDDLDDALLSEYAERTGHPDPARLLSARGLTGRKGELTVAAVLLFGRQPQWWFPEASLRVLRYRGSERGTGARQQLVDDRRIDGPLPHQITHAAELIAEQLPTRRALGRSGRFGQVGLIPRDAWLEAVVNAAVHRSYSRSGDHIRVEIFDDRVEVESPGRFPGIAAAANPLDVTRFARNPRVARVCAELGFGQELGEGLRRIVDEMRLAGLAPPTFFQSSGSVRVTLSGGLVDRGSEQLTAEAMEVLQLLRQAGRMRTGDVVASSGHSRPIAIRLLNALVTAGLVERVATGPKDPQAYWTVPGS
jgi:ATP-dependent DNA helicase RecG